MERYHGVFSRGSSVVTQAVIAVLRPKYLHVPGAFFTGTTFPSGDKVKLDSETASKQGKSSCYSVFALVAFGDCSINSAMKHGGITKIHHVDSSSMNVLYFFFKYDTIVYGE